MKRKLLRELIPSLLGNLKIQDLIMRVISPSLGERRNHHLSLLLKEINPILEMWIAILRRRPYPQLRELRDQEAKRLLYLTKQVHRNLFAIKLTSWTDEDLYNTFILMTLSLIENYFPHKNFLTYLIANIRYLIANMITNRAESEQDRSSGLSLETTTYYGLNPKDYDIQYSNQEEYCTLMKLNHINQILTLHIIDDIDVMSSSRALGFNVNMIEKLTQETKGYIKESQSCQ